MAASNNVFAIYPFVPLTQYGVKKIMKMTVFLFSKFNRLPFFLALKVSYRVQWGSKFPHALSLLKRLTIALENHLLIENHPQNKDENVVGVVSYTDAGSKLFRKKFVVF